ncbi:hypothetical protein ACF08N_33880 [Streptomyces sp. NPDC015127]|uniref:hypothetical protein n=1 Tax=Streptomyces sp. NPDC015127 TaxID=3364939 RepID=UPI0037001F0C
MIYGASDTGKSYIEEAVDYMLGASDLKSIPEDDGYSSILLGLRVDDGRVLTLSRALGSDNIAVFNGDLRGFPSQPADATLKHKHHPNSQKNISWYLLKVMGIDGRRILQNSRGDVVPLNFRDLARLARQRHTHGRMRSPVLGTRRRTGPTRSRSSSCCSVARKSRLAQPAAGSANPLCGIGNGWLRRARCAAGDVYGSSALFVASVTAVVCALLAAADGARPELVVCCCSPRPPCSSPPSTTRRTGCPTCSLCQLPRQCSPCWASPRCSRCRRQLDVRTVRSLTLGASYFARWSGAPAGGQPPTLRSVPTGHQDGNSPPQPTRRRID